MCVRGEGEGTGLVVEVIGRNSRGCGPRSWLVSGKEWASRIGGSARKGPRETESRRKAVSVTRRVVGSTNKCGDGPVYM